MSELSLEEKTNIRLLVEEIILFDHIFTKQEKIIYDLLLENLEIESQNMILTESNKESENIFADSGQKVEEEINELTSSEDKDLKDHYEINDDLQSLENTSSSEVDEQERIS